MANLCLLSLRPACTAGHRAHRSGRKRENVTFFRRPQEAETAGFRECLRCRPKAIAGNPRQELIKSVCRYIEQHLDEPVTLARLGAEFHQSPFHLQTNVQGGARDHAQRICGFMPHARFSAEAEGRASVTRAMHDAGYSSTSRLYSRTSAELGMEPAKYRRGAIATPIRYSVTESPIGRMLIAATDKGICTIQFADSEEELEQGLKQEFPFALRRRDDRAWRNLAGQVVQRILASEPLLSLPLDIQATAFQRRVWSYLQSIAFGKTQIVHRSCKSHPASFGGPCGCAGMRHQPRGHRNPVPPRAAL